MNAWDALEAIGAGDWDRHLDQLGSAIADRQRARLSGPLCARCWRPAGHHPGPDCEAWVGPVPGGLESVEWPGAGAP